MTAVHVGGRGPLNAPALGSGKAPSRRKTSRRVTSFLKANDAQLPLQSLVKETRETRFSKQSASDRHDLDHQRVHKQVREDDGDLVTPPGAC